MLWYEFDWRHSSTQRIFEALSEGLKSVEHDFEEAEQSNEFYFDAGQALEHMEGLFGIAFVTAQTYIAGTVSDANRIARSGIKFKKDQLLKDYSDYLLGLTVTKLELCDAIANYFKHHDEWTSWSGVGRHQKAVSILQAAGIKEDDSYPCVAVANILVTKDSLDLEPLLSVLSNWHEAVINAAKLK